MTYFIVVYKSTFDAMEAERILNEKGYDFKIMPTPTSITQSCGICTRFVSEDDISSIIESNIIEYKNILKKEENGFVLIK